MPKDNKSVKGLSIIVVGAGKVGRTLVGMLNKEGHDIVVIDKNPQKITYITELYDVMGLNGNGATQSVLEEAGIASADLFIAVTNSDELNLLCCTLARRYNHCSAIARVRNPEYTAKDVAFLQEKLGLAMVINPEQETAREISKILSLPSALEVNSFAHGQAEMIELEVPEGSILDGIKVMDLNAHIKSKCLITAVKRDDYVHIASGKSVLHAGDIISIVGARTFAKGFLKETGMATRQVKNCLIVGGGICGFYLARYLINGGIDVKIIEQDKEVCEFLSVQLPKALIINGDGSDERLLMEEGISDIESFVPLTGMDEENIILTLYAHQTSNAKVVTKMDRDNFNNVLKQLNLGSVMSPQSITSEAIVAYVRAKSASNDENIQTLYHLHEGRVEAIEFKITEKSNCTGTPLSKLRLKKDVLVSFINRGGNIIIPGGNDSIEVGDTVMIVTIHEGFVHITDILA